MDLISDEDQCAKREIPKVQFKRQRQDRHGDRGHGDGGPERRTAKKVHAPRVTQGSMKFASDRGRAQVQEKQQQTAGTRGFSATQDYATIKAECLAQGKLFEDPEFPADNHSLALADLDDHEIYWKRPGKLVADPKFFVGGASRFDVKQGYLGDCWLLAAIASLSMYKELFYRVVPCEQNFEEDYCGLFRFQLWSFGEWIEVVVDDRLPVEDGQLAFIHSVDENEFWSALLEKAFAKVFGSYDALTGGSSGEALEDFTGGLLQYVELSELDEVKRKNLFETLVDYQARCSLMGCSIPIQDDGVIEEKLPSGLVVGHAYSVTGVRDLQTSIGHFQLIRLRNPWGDTEWTGAWSDGSREWAAISDDEKGQLGITFEDDGEFWMEYSDFTKHFQILEICHLSPDAFNAADEGSEQSMNGKTKKVWQVVGEPSAWRKNVSAGGCKRYMDTYAMNPQFHVEITECDEGTDTGTLIVGLMQKDNRAERKELGTELYSLGFMIYPTEGEKGVLDKMYFKKHRSIASAGYINLREVSGKFHLKPGNYVVVPTTFEPNEETEFLIRLVSETKQEIVQGDEETKFNAVGMEISNETMDIAKQWFDIYSGEDKQLDAYELQDLLNQVFKSKHIQMKEFTIETCRSLIALKDFDQSGKLDVDEFAHLLESLRYWQAVYLKFDSDGDGDFNTSELRKAYEYLGIKLSNKNFNSVVKRYSNREGKIRFQDFLLSAARITILFESFNAKQSDGGGATFEAEDFIQMMLYV